MIADVIKLLQSHDFMRCSELIEIAKGKNDLKLSKKIKKLRKWQSEKK
jgi:hypothetical protein